MKPAWSIDCRSFPRLSILIDSSRNGWGGSTRPTAESDGTSDATLVSDPKRAHSRPFHFRSFVDRRSPRGHRAAVSAGLAAVA